MIIARYIHRLPADYDLGIIRRRAVERGPLWDAVPELYFKTFLLRQAGHQGATANSYGSLYLWRRDDVFRDFLGAGIEGKPANAFKAVTDSFGRPQIQTWLTLDARKGPAREAQLATIEEVDVGADADLSAVFAAEVERNRQAAATSGAAAAAVGLDPLNWKLIRILLSSETSSADRSRQSFEILHLAQPLLETLPR